LIHTKVSGKRYERKSVIALSNHSQLFEPMIYKETADKDLMLAYFSQVLPKLKPGSIIVMDNASFHKSKELRDLFRRFNIELLYLPPYSPDLNPIEKIWGNIKKELRNYFDYSKNLFENLCNVISKNTIEIC
jgi:transposase